MTATPDFHLDVPDPSADLSPTPDVLQFVANLRHIKRFFANDDPDLALHAYGLHGHLEGGCGEEVEDVDGGRSTNNADPSPFSCLPTCTEVSLVKGASLNGRPVQVRCEMPAGRLHPQNGHVAMFFSDQTGLSRAVWTDGSTA